MTEHSEPRGSDGETVGVFSEGFKGRTLTKVSGVGGKRMGGISNDRNRSTEAKKPCKMYYRQESSLNAIVTLGWRELESTN